MAAGQWLGPLGPRERENGVRGGPTVKHTHQMMYHGKPIVVTVDMEAIGNWYGGRATTFRRESPVRALGGAIIVEALPAEGNESLAAPTPENPNRPMNDPIFHLPRFWLFRFRRLCAAFVTSFFGTWTSLRAKASNALNPDGFFAFLAMLLLLFCFAPPATAAGRSWIVTHEHLMAAFQDMPAILDTDDLSQRIAARPLPCTNHLFAAPFYEAIHAEHSTWCNNRPSFSGHDLLSAIGAKANVRCLLGVAHSATTRRLVRTLFHPAIPSWQAGLCHLFDPHEASVSDGGKLAVGQPLADNLPQCLMKPLKVGLQAVVEPECLFRHVPSDVERGDRNVGSLDGSLEERPEVFQAVRVGIALDVALRVVNRPVNVGQAQRSP